VISSMIAKIRIIEAMQAINKSTATPFLHVAVERGGTGQ